MIGSLFPCLNAQTRKFKGRQELLLLLSYCLAVHRVLKSINSMFWCKLPTVLVYLDVEAEGACHHRVYVPFIIW